MDAEALVTTLEDEHETELSRLGSSKALYAVTGGDMERAAVLSSLADRAESAAVTFGGWAEDGDDDAASVFAELAEEERDHARRLADPVDATVENDPTPLDAYLRGLDDPRERAGGALAWALVTDRTLSQGVGFFVGSAARGEADVLRGLRSETDSQRERIAELLEDSLETDDDWAAAEEAASGAVEAGYEFYVESLEALGISVKPVC